MPAAGKTGPATQRRKPPQPEPDLDIQRKMRNRKARASFLPFRLSVRQLSIAGVVFVALSLLLWLKGPEHGLSLSTPSDPVDWDVRRDEVKEAFVTSWDAYAKYARGSSATSHSTTQSPRMSGGFVHVQKEC
jgi:hypothetical protein